MSLVSLAYMLLLVNSFNSTAQVIDRPKGSLTLSINQSSGTNGSGITYDPGKQLYYVVIAGNASFPMEVFNAKGDNVFQTETGSDMRGIWWNSKTKSIEGNCYADGGIVSMKLDASGYPSLGNTTLMSGDNHQPNVNSCGVYDGKKLIYFIDGDKIYTYSRKNGAAAGTLDLQLSYDAKVNLNYTSMIYTGKKGMEIGVLDHINKKIYLLNKKTGSVSATITLPYEATCHESFRFGYANNYAFIYDTETRSWTGYRIFE